MQPNFIIFFTFVAEVVVKPRGGGADGQLPVEDEEMNGERDTLSTFNFHFFLFSPFLFLERKRAESVTPPPLMIADPADVAKALAETAAAEAEAKGNDAMGAKDFQRALDNFEASLGFQPSFVRYRLAVNAAYELKEYGKCMGIFEAWGVGLSDDLIEEDFRGIEFACLASLQLFNFKEAHHLLLLVPEAKRSQQVIEAKKTVEKAAFALLELAAGSFENAAKAFSDAADNDFINDDLRDELEMRSQSAFTKQLAERRKRSKGSANSSAALQSPCSADSSSVMEIAGGSIPQIKVDAAAKVVTMPCQVSLKRMGRIFESTTESSTRKRGYGQIAQPKKQKTMNQDQEHEPKQLVTKTKKKKLKIAPKSKVVSLKCPNCPKMIYKKTLTTHLRTCMREEFGLRCRFCDAFEASDRQDALRHHLFEKHAQ